MASLKHKKNVLTSILFEAIVELSGAILTCDWIACDRRRHSACPEKAPVQINMLRHTTAQPCF